MLTPLKIAANVGYVPTTGLLSWYAISSLFSLAHVAMDATSLA
jgi:hypothetical protein